MFTYSGDTKEFTNTLIYDNQKYTHSNRISQESKKRIWQITYAQEVGSHHKKGWVCLITCKGD
jgi:glutamine cyclotransferase